MNGLFLLVTRPAVLGAFALLTTAACGGSRPRTEGETSAAFARIQVGEARIATASLRARDPARDCPTRGGSAREVCAAADDVCAEAAPLADDDADARCEDARDACAEVRRAVSAACGAESGEGEA